jgi:hypothetical protein
VTNDEGEGRRWGQVVSTPSQCAVCAHFSRGGDFPTSACRPYMGGIPDDILMNRADHREPYDGDDGIRFAPAADVLADVLARVYSTLDALHRPPA